MPTSRSSREEAAGDQSAASYRQLEAEQEKRPRKVRDHTATWNRLKPLSDVNGTVRDRVESFAQAKRISFEALEALGTRVIVRKSGEVQLAFAGENGAGVITAIKYRPLNGSSHDSTSETSSSWIRPIIVGKRDSLNWIIAEGETDGARLFDLVGDRAAILILPTGARTFQREWVALIPRGATVALCYDADEEGDKGAEKAQRIIAGNTLRVRPPEGDWCDWDGDRDAFLELLASSRRPSIVFSSLDDFLAHPYPKAEPLLGKPGEVFLALGSLLMVYGLDGSGKSTWTIDGIAHLAAGRDWLGIPVPRPVRFCIIENEGPPNLFQQKLTAKVASWDGPDFSKNLFVLTQPWGEFTFADPAARAELVAFCEEHKVDVVTANPTLGLGVAASGRPDETQLFVDWLVECGLKSTLAFWLLHHENKAGQISGDWGRHPDAKVLLQQDGNNTRTKLTWDKARWASLPSETTAKAVMLEWIIETQGYTVTELDTTVGASDAELEQRIVDFLTANPGSSTRAVMSVSGTNDRIRTLLEGAKFECVGGPRNSLLWSLAKESDSTASEGPTQSPNHQLAIGMDKEIE